MSFIAWLKKHVCEDDAWITVHPNASGPGSHVLLDDEGYIKGGMGGKFTGQRIDLMPRKPKAPPSGEVKLPSRRYSLTPPSKMTASEKTATEWGHIAAEAMALSAQRLKNSTENETKYNNWVDEANELMGARTLPRPKTFTAENVPETFADRFKGVDTLNALNSPQVQEAAASKAMFDLAQETGNADLLKQPPEQMKQSFTAIREKLAEEKAKFEEKAAAYLPEINKREESLYQKMESAKTGKQEIGIEITRLQDAERRIDMERELFKRGEQMLNELEEKYTGGTESKAQASRAGYSSEVREAAKKFDEVTDPRKMWDTYEAAVSAVEPNAASEKEFKRAKHDLYVEMQNADKMLRARLSSEVKAKHLDIPPGQKRLFDPVFIERETEKAYGVRNDVYYQAKERLDAGESERDLLPYERTAIRERKSLNWYPKSRTTAAEGHIIGAEKWLTERNGNMAEDCYCLDAAPSHRRFDENGFMHVDSCHVTKEQVVKYYGREIPGWRELGLDPERLYNVYRPGDEIEKAAATFDGLPLQLQHHIDSADEPQTEFRVGSISRPVWRAPYLDCDLHITNGAAISAVEHGDFKEISAAYLYEPVIESGEFDGTPYEIVMRNLRGNHVALVPKGRAGADVVVADEAPDAPPLRSFAAWMRKNPLSLKDAPSPEWEATRNALDKN